MIIDLSHPLGQKTPVYPGDSSPKIEEFLNIKEHGCCVSSLTIGTHVGTHIDAPSHMIEGGKNIDEYGPERFVLNAVCIDVRGGFESNEIVAALKGHNAVVFYAGFEQKYGTEDYWSGYPIMDESCVEMLVACGVTLVGMDMAAPDLDEDFPIHKALLSKDILIVENLTNLGQLVDKTFELTVLPLKLELDGSPVRAVARIEAV